jgi:cyclopropane-fatty-acyl-phospholipid synthase
MFGIGLVEAGLVPDLLVCLGIRRLLRRRMFENLTPMRALGLSERFLRMWEFYPCYCEGGFEERQIGVVQALFEKSDARRDPVLGRIA